MNQRAIAALVDERQKVKDDCEREMAELDRLIASLKRDEIDDAGDKRSITKVRPGQYSGMRMAAALQAYLNERE